MKINKILILFFFINEISSNTINYNSSYFLTKLSNHSELNDVKSIQLSGIKRLEWIVVPSMLNVALLVYDMSNFIFRGSKWGCPLQKHIKAWIKNINVKVLPEPTPLVMNKWIG